jgi:hypothetical protein
VEVELIMLLRLYGMLRLHTPKLVLLLLYIVQSRIQRLLNLLDLPHSKGFLVVRLQPAAP